MKSGSKYHALYTYLSQSGQEEIPLSFIEVEAILGKVLPPSARTRRDWWGNRIGALQALAWMNAGYRVAALDMEAGVVTFARPVKKTAVRLEGDIVRWDCDLIKALRLHMGLSQTQFASELNVRQQTISEWENGLYAPARASCKHLMLVAEQSGFQYEIE